MTPRDRLLESLAPDVVEALEELVAEALERREQAPPVTWLTVEEAAEQRRTTPAAMRARCERGQIPGAVRDGRRWLIPSLEPDFGLS